MNGVGITVIYVIGIHIDLIAEIRNDLIDQGRDVGLIPSEMALLEKLIFLQKHVIIYASAFTVTDVIFLLKLYGNECRDQYGESQNNHNNELRKDPFFTVLSVCGAAFLFFFRHFSKPPFFDI